MRPARLPTSSRSARALVLLGCAVVAGAGAGIARAAPAPGATAAPGTTATESEGEGEAAGATLHAEPGVARFAMVQKEGDETIGHTIWSDDGATFRVLAVESTNPALRVSFREPNAVERRAREGSQWRVESVLPADAAVGKLGGEIVVVTDHPGQQRLRIPVTGVVRPMVVVTPPVADLGAVDPAKPRSMLVEVKSFASRALVLEHADADVRGVTAEIVPVIPGRAYKVRIATTPGLPAGPLSGTVTVVTGSSKLPHIEIPVRGQVAEGSAPAR